jgi:N-acetyl-gamma-glutamyl-phosphate reductase
MISVGLIGGSGYTGKKIIQFCNNHPNINNFKIYGSSSAGKNILDIFPELQNEIDNSEIISADTISFEHDVYFLALPHGEALKYVPELIQKGKKVIDIGGDFRLANGEIYEKWYKIKHTAPELLNQKVYGLADDPTTYYTDAKLIANPGCYPTAALLALIPFVKNYNDEIISVSVSAYSGTSGAGKSPKTHLLMSEMDSNVAAYNLNEHRHEPEILQTLEKNGFDSPFAFVTHLLPAAVGIYSTSFIHTKSKLDKNEIENVYNQFYANSSFIRMRTSPPQLNWVVNTNYCDIHISVKGNKVIIISAIDNLIKGASGQAIQNLNKIYGWKEYLGIKEGSSYESVF